MSNCEDDLEESTLTPFTITINTMLGGTFIIEVTGNLKVFHLKDMLYQIQVSE